MTATTTQIGLGEATFDAIADEKTLWDRLHSSLDMQGPIAIGERLAALLASKNSGEVAALDMDDETARAMFELLDQARSNLLARVELIENAMLRAVFWAKATAPEGSDNGTN